MRVAHLAPLASGLALTWAAALDLSPRDLAARDHEIDQFERRFLDTLGWEHANDTVKLVGFKRIIMPEDQLDDLHDHATRSLVEWDQFPSAYYEPYERAVRLYFPVKNALVYHGDDLVEASHLGEYPAHDRLHGDCRVVGRYQTDQVHGTAGNRVEGGVVYLGEPEAPVRAYGDPGNVLMYDFGWREGPHAHGHGKRQGVRPGPVVEAGAAAGEAGHDGGSCLENHGGKTCSEVYNINQGRCERDYSGCIDYNGWWPNCEGKGGWKAFFMSDCFVSVTRGNCWNEVPPAVLSKITGEE